MLHISSLMCDMIALEQETQNTRGGEIYGIQSIRCSKLE